MDWWLIPLAIFAFAVVVPALAYITAVLAIRWLEHDRKKRMS